MPPKAYKVPLAAAPDKPVKLADLARRVGVCVTTVSDILNRPAGTRYSAATRERVQRLAAESGYVPSRTAQQLVQRRSGEIAFVLTRTLGNPYWARVLDAVERELRAQGYRIQLGMADVTSGAGADRLSAIRGSQVDAAIIGPVYTLQHLQSVERALRGSPPVVLFGYDLGVYDAVLADDYRCGQIAAELLLEHRHTRINYFCGPAPELERAGAKCRGLRERLATCGAFDPAWYTFCFDSGALADIAAVCDSFTRRWRAAPPSRRPTALFCHNDQVALVATGAFFRAGIQVPRDLALIGCDNLPESAHLVPPLTTIDNHVGEQMRLVVETVLWRMANPAAPRRVQVVAPTLVVRESV